LKMSDYSKIKPSNKLKQLNSNIPPPSHSSSTFETYETNWQELWDALFWRFIDKNRQYFQSNPRLGMMVITYDKMNEAKRDRLNSIAEAHLV
jgi:hypothetical protein